MNDSSDDHCEARAFPPQEYRICLTVGSHSPRHVRRVVREMVRLWHMPQLADAAELVVTELLVNVFRHVPDHRCTVTVRRHEDGAGIAVHDDHPVLPEVRDAGIWEEGGRGLALVAAATDKWGVAPDEGGGGKTVWCELWA